MAKKKAAAKPIDTFPPKKTPAQTRAAAKAPALSNDLIGDVAGKLWHTLAAGPQTLAALKKSIDAPTDLVLTALGWLAREGKISFDNNGRSVTVSLR